MRLNAGTETNGDVGDCAETPVNHASQGSDDVPPLNRHDPNRRWSNKMMIESPSSSQEPAAEAVNVDEITVGTDDDERPLPDSDEEQNSSSSENVSPQKSRQLTLRKKNARFVEKLRLLNEEKERKRNKPVRDATDIQTVNDAGAANADSDLEESQSNSDVDGHQGWMNYADYKALPSVLPSHEEYDSRKWYWDGSSYKRRYYRRAKHHRKMQSSPSSSRSSVLDADQEQKDQMISDADDAFTLNDPLGEQGPCVKGDRPKTRPYNKYFDDGPGTSHSTNHPIEFPPSSSEFIQKVASGRYLYGTFWVTHCKRLDVRRIGLWVNGEHPIHVEFDRNPPRRLLSCQCFVTMRAEIDQHNNHLIIDDGDWEDSWLMVARQPNERTRECLYRKRIAKEKSGGMWLKGEDVRRVTVAEVVQKDLPPSQKPPGVPVAILRPYIHDVNWAGDNLCLTLTASEHDSSAKLAVKFKHPPHFLENLQLGMTIKVLHGYATPSGKLVAIGYCGNYGNDEGTDGPT